MDGELLTIEQTAQKLSVNPMTVRRWIKQGKIQSTRLGEKLLRIKSNALDDFVNGKYEKQPKKQEVAKPSQPEISLQATEEAKAAETCANETGLPLNEPKPATNTNQLLSTSEVAKMAGTKHGSVNKAKERAKIKGVAIGQKT